MLQETNIPDYKSANNYMWPTQAVANVLRKLYSPSTLRNMSPSYKLVQSDWDALSKKFDAFPDDYSFQSILLERSISGEKELMMKLSYGSLKPDNSITCFAQIVVSFDPNSAHPEIIKIKVNAGNEVSQLKLKLTDSEFVSYKNSAEAYKNVPPPPPDKK